MKIIKFSLYTLRIYCVFYKVFYFFKPAFSRKTPLAIILLSTISFLSQGQISIIFPVPRAVIQRDNANQASLNIAGRIKNQIDRIEARLIPRTEQARLDTVVATPWQTVQ